MFAFYHGYTKARSSLSVSVCRGHKEWHSSHFHFHFIRFVLFPSFTFHNGLVCSVAIVFFFPSFFLGCHCSLFSSQVGSKSKLVRKARWYDKHKVITRKGGGLFFPSRFLLAISSEVRMNE